jgi:hypothetical protein
MIKTDFSINTGNIIGIVFIILAVIAIILAAVIA